MPLNTGPSAATPGGIQDNIERMIAEGVATDEAVAVAHHIAETIRSEDGNSTSTG